MIMLVRLYYTLITKRSFMSTFAIIMLGTTVFFAYQIYRHVQTLEDPVEINEEPAPTLLTTQTLPLCQ